MTFLLRLLAEPRVIAVVLVAAALGLGWWHYTGLRSDLATARADLVAAQAEMRAAIEIANQNVEQLRRAEAQHRASIAALEDAYESLTAVREQARRAEQDVIAAPAGRDGPVAPILEDLRINRFGGQP